MQRFHEATEGVAGLLDGPDTHMRVTADERDEYEAAMRDYYGDP